MIFIFGFRTRVAVLATVSLACRNGHVAAHRIVKLTRWFTLFFVPVIPFNRTHRSVCIQCGLTLEIPKGAAEDLAARAGAGSASSVAGAIMGPGQDPVAPPLPSLGAEPVLPPAGWYPDPAGTGARRYWDGGAWTESVQHP
jgi:hypothetical protein